jgi:hypothetical protein
MEGTLENEANLRPRRLLAIRGKCRNLQVVLGVFVFPHNDTSSEVIAGGFDLRIAFRVE